MKIAIMTQPLGKNYGGIMQAWALQQVLIRMGHDPVTVDRDFKKPNFLYEAARLTYKTGLKIIGKGNGYANLDAHLHIILKNTENFLTANLAQSPKLTNSTQLKRHFNDSKYDAVIVGSDQTWRPKYSPNIYNFFLDFAQDLDIKRVAYASSFGTEEWEFTALQQKRCSRLAQRFDLISVREQSGLDLCRKHLYVNASLALDPTLLLDRSDYEHLIKDNVNTHPSEGLFTYFLDPSQQKDNIVELLARHTDLTSYSCQPKRWLDSHSSSNHEDYTLPKVEDWLSSLAKAKFVVTDSFHGMVFALIFNKNFLVIKNHDRGTARFSSLLGQLGLLDRLIEPTNAGDLVLKSRPIDYDPILTTLMSLKTRSISLIEQALR